MEKSDTEKGQKEMKDGVDFGAGKSKRSSCFPKKIVAEFCAETSLHGLKYVGQKNRHLSERIFWVAGLLASLSLAAYLIHTVWEKYQKSPVIITFKSTQQDTRWIPHPAVTICSLNQFSRSKMLELEEIVKNGSNSSSDPAQYNLAEQKLGLVKQICWNQRNFRTVSDSIDFNINILRENASLTAVKELEDFLRNYTTSCDDLIKFSWPWTKPLITDVGKCCVANMLPLPLMVNNNNKTTLLLGKSQEWTYADEKYKFQEWNKWEYKKSLLLPIHRSTRFQVPSSQGLYKRLDGFNLLVEVETNADDNYCGRFDNNGFLYTIHSPLEMPNPKDFAAVASPGKQIFVKVNPDVITAHHDIINVDKKKRKCYFPDEHKLDFFRPYTEKNCQDDCYAKVYMKFCNCSYFYLPRTEGVKICSQRDCNSVSDEYWRLSFDCRKRCYPLCEHIEYNYDTSTTTLRDSSDLWKKTNETPRWGDKATLLKVFMGSKTIVPKERTRLYDWTDLVSNSGGILGLCLGLSILSLLEIVYFGTLRAICEFFKLGWAKSEQNFNFPAKLKQVIYCIRGQQKNKVSQIDPIKSENTIPGNDHEIV